MKRLLASCSILAALAAGPANAAVVLLDNSSGTIGGTNLGTGGDWAAIGFTLGASPANYTISEIQVLAGLQSGSTVNTGDLTVRLFAGNGSQPTGTAVATKTMTGLTFKSSPVANDATIVDTTTGSASGSSWVLSASTNYFLVFSSSTSAFALKSGDPYSTGGGVTSVGRSFSTNGGSTWGGPFQSALPWLKVTADGGSGGGSSVPDAGPGPALALLRGGLKDTLDSFKKASPGNQGGFLMGSATLGAPGLM